MANDALEIPFVGGIGYYRFGTTIESTPYLFDVRWNDRDQSWRFDVLEIDETLIAAGIRINLGVYMGRQYNHPLFKGGVFVAVDLSGKRIEAGYLDLGTRVVVQYIPVLELLTRLTRFG